MRHVKESLLELKVYYDSLIADYQSKIAHAKEQLTHVEALLLDLPSPPLNSLAIQIQNKVPLSLWSDDDKSNNNNETDDVDDVDDVDYERQSIIDDINTENTTIDPALVPEELSVVELPETGNYRRIFTVFQENKEKILHFQYILSTLHNKAGLQESEIPELKKRLRWELAYGIKRGFWHKVVGEDGCYTL